MPDWKVKELSDEVERGDITRLAKEEWEKKYGDFEQKMDLIRHKYEKRFLSMFRGSLESEKGASKGGKMTDVPSMQEVVHASLVPGQTWEGKEKLRGSCLGSQRRSEDGMHEQIIISSNCERLTISY